MAPPSATDAADAASHPTEMDTAALKDIANTTTKELPPTPGDYTDGAVLPHVDLSTLEGGPSFAIRTKTLAATDISATISTLPIHGTAGNIPRKQVPAPAPTPVQQQPFRFGQPPQSTGIRYPPGFNPPDTVQRPVRPPRQNSVATPPFVPAAPPSALSSPANTPRVTSPVLPIPNSREFTFNVPASASTVSPPLTPLFPDTNVEQKKMFLTERHRKRNMAMTPAVSEYEADLTSKDRMKQKEAVKKILESKVRSDWAENWVNTVPEVRDLLAPAEGDAPELGGDGVVEEKWVERTEWLSELSSSGDEEDAAVAGAPLSRVSSLEERPGFLRRLSSGKAHADPFRFENPDSVGEVLKRKTERKKVRRQKRFVEELKENEGLRCFTARRNVWTGAKIVHRPAGSRPTSKASASVRGGASAELSKMGETNCETASVPAEVAEQQNRAAMAMSPLAADGVVEEKDEWDDVVLIDTLIPIPPPLLPPSTPMRKNVTSRNYTTIYDKIILGGQTPLCPINLQTVVSSCVEGWKRDGEWPPRSTVENDALLSRKKVIGEVKKPAGGGGPGWRRSLQKVFGGRADGPI